MKHQPSSCGAGAPSRTKPMSNSVVMDCKLEVPPHLTSPLPASFLNNNFIYNAAAPKMNLTPQSTGTVVVQ